MQSSNYFFAFIDVLGFSELVFKAEKGNSEAKRKVSIYASKGYEITSALEKIPSKAQIKLQTRVFSDSLMVFVPIEKSKIKEILQHLCVATAKIQYELSQNDLWTRGAISEGRLRVEESTLIGSALINAYNIEENFANWPRVIIDPSLLQHFAGSSRKLESSMNEHNFSDWSGDLIFRHHENLNDALKSDYLFIDYLSPLFCGADKAEIDKIITLVKNNLCSSPSIHIKHQMVKRYLRSHFAKGNLSHSSNPRHDFNKDDFEELLSLG